MQTINNSSKKIYFKNIDIFRFIFSVMVVILHLTCISAYPNLVGQHSFDLIYNNTNKLGWVVELFFIISGFFLIISTTLPISIFQFIKKRFIRLFPVLFITTILFIIIIPLKIIKFYFWENIFTLLFSNGIEIVFHKGIYAGLGNIHSTWFISVLLYVSIFYLYIIKNFGYKIFNFMMWFIIIIGLHLMTFHMNKDLFYVVPIGLIRGLTCIGIGCVLGEFYNKFKDLIFTIQLNILQKVFMTLLEVSLFFYLLFVLLFSTKDRAELGDVIFIFIILFILFIFKQGYFSKILDKDFSVTLGKYSYSIFVTHCFILEILKKYYYTINNYLIFRDRHLLFFYFVIPVFICIIFGIFIYYIAEVPAIRGLNKKIRRKTTNEE